MMAERVRGRPAWSLLLVLGLVVGLVAGARVAWAYWSASATVAGPPALASGSLDVTVEGQLLGRGGTFPLADLTLASGVPGSADAADVTVGNAGTTPITLAVTATPSGALAPYLQTTVVYGGTATGTSCTGGSTTPPVLQPGATTSVCVVESIASTAPASAQRQTGSVTLGLVATQAAPAQAWTDTATVTGGPFATWAGITSVACPAPPFGANHTLSWSGPPGTTYTVAITSNPQPSGLSSWTQALPRPGQPLTTTGTSAQWGIATSNPLESTAFTGTWTLTATAPGGAWTATRTGTWQIDYNLPLPGTNACSVNP